MSSLVPGPLFSTSGLNRHSVPARVGSTSSQISQTHRREAFNGHPWPQESPVARVYDIVNTPTKLILLNNKKSRKYCHLRGHSSLDTHRIPMPEPDRHFTGASYVNKALHIECSKSESPRFTPTQTSLEWSNELCRPRTTFSNGSLVNPRHHESCLGHNGPNDFYTNLSPSSGRKTRQTRITRPPACYLQLKLDDSGLTKGQKSYLWSISKVYSSENQRRHQQQQYFDLLRAEIRKGGHESRLLYKYAHYLESPRKTRCGKDDRIKRVQSAPIQQQHDKKLSVKKSQNQRCASSTGKLLKGRQTRAPTSLSSSNYDSGTENSIQSDSSFSIDNFNRGSREGTLRPKSRIGRPKSSSQKSETESQKANTIVNKEKGSDGKTKNDGTMSQQKIKEVNESEDQGSSNPELPENAVSEKVNDKISVQTLKDEKAHRNKNIDEQSTSGSSKGSTASTAEVASIAVQEKRVDPQKGEIDEGSKRSTENLENKADNLKKTDNVYFESKRSGSAENLYQIEPEDKSKSVRKGSNQSLENEMIVNQKQEKSKSKSVRQDSNQSLENQLEMIVNQKQEKSKSKSVRQDSNQSLQNQMNVNQKQEKSKSKSVRQDSNQSLQNQLEMIVNQKQEESKSKSVRQDSNQSLQNQLEMIVNQKQEKSKSKSVIQDSNQSLQNQMIVNQNLSEEIRPSSASSDELEPLDPDFLEY